MKRLLCICILLGYAFVLGQTESAQDVTWSGYQSAYDAHMKSADSAQMKANLSLVAAIGTLAYGYFTGVFSDDD